MRSRLRRIALFCLASISMVFPAYFLSLLLGVTLFAADLVRSVVFVAIPVLSMGLLLLWAVKELRQANHLSERTRRRWLVSFFLTGFIGAFCFLWSAPTTPEEVKSARTGPA
jgi:hypothetical protein